MPNSTLEKWEEKTLDEICNFSRGLTYSKKDEVETSNNIVLRANNIDLISNSLNFDELKYINSEIIIPEDKKVKANSIMICISSGSKSHLGKVAFIDKNYGYAFGGFMGLIIPNDNILPKFLYYMLISPAFKNLIFNLTDGANINNLKYSDLKDFKLNIPPLSEQQRIVGILDEAFENIEKAKQNALQNLNNAKELFESYLTSILINKDNWDKKKLSDVAIDFGRGRSRHRPRNDKKLYGGQYPFIQTGDIRNSNHLITEYSQTYNEIGLAQSKLWPKGTLCITIAANIAETGVLTFDACFPDSVIGCVFDETKTNIDYVEYLLQSFKTILQAEGKGSAQDNINLGTFEKHYFPFPNKAKQDEIVDKLNCMRTNIAKLEQIYEQRIKDLDELKQSILQKAFNGEL